MEMRNAQDCTCMNEDDNLDKLRADTEKVVPLPLLGLGEGQMHGIPRCQPSLECYSNTTEAMGTILARELLLWPNFTHNFLPCN